MTQAPSTNTVVSGPWPGRPARAAPPGGQAERAVEDRRHHAPEPQRGVQAGRQRAQRARADRGDLLQAGLRLHSRRGPARPVPLVGPLHPAQPGIDGGKTATLEPDELDDEYFMLRVRIDGGALTTEQLRVIGEHLHRVRPRHRRRHRPAEHPAALDRGRGRARDLAPARGRRARHHRGVRRLPARHPRLAGGRHRRRRDHRPDPRDRRDRRRFIGDPELSNLPRKFKTAITGHPSQDVVHEINDIAFVGVVHPELGPGYDLWVGGGLSTNPRSASASARSSRRSGSPRSGSGWSSIFRDYGYRRLRNKARLKFLLADWGAAKFRAGAGDRVPGLRRCPTGPRPAPAPRPATTSACTRRRTAAATSASRPPWAASPARTLAAARRPGRGARLRPACGPPRTRRSWCSTSRRGPRRVARSTALRRAGLARPRPSLFRRGTMACTGIEFCKLAIVETKDTRPPPSPSSRSGSRHRRCRSRSRCTSTAAPTRAPASRPPTSASRASSCTERRRAGPRLPGAPRRRARLADRDEAGSAAPSAG